MALNSLNTHRWRRLRRRLLREAGYTCSACGRFSAQLEIHHVVPLHRGGAPYDPANLRVLCRGCHIEVHLPDVKGQRDWIQFLRETGSG